MPTLVIFSASYADEFSCEEFRIVPQDLLEVQAEIRRLCDKCSDKNPFYFGTNEWFEDLYVGDFSLKEITKDEEAVLIALLDDQFGTGILSKLFEDVEDYEEEYIEE